MSASARLAAAFAVAAPLLLCALPATAADLGSPYDDPRYGDAYAPGESHAYAGEPEDFEPVGPPPPRRDVYRNRDADDFGGPPRRWARDDDGCVPRRAIAARLRADGWYDFEDLDLRGSVAVVTARSPSGRPFDLTIDRCSGDIVDARPLEGRRDYAYGTGSYPVAPRRGWHPPY